MKKGSDQCKSRACVGRYIYRVSYFNVLSGLIIVRACATAQSNVTSELVGILSR